MAAAFHSSGPVLVRPAILIIPVALAFPSPQASCSCQEEAAVAAAPAAARAQHWAEVGPAEARDGLPVVTAAEAPAESAKAAVVLAGAEVRC